MQDTKMIEKKCENCLHYRACILNSEYVPTLCRIYEDRTNYRKQSEGEWITVGKGITERVVCSNCHSEKGSFLKPPFCNQCGAKMKGGME